MIPEESQEPKAVLYGHHHYVLIGCQYRPIILEGSAHVQSPSMDPHHHLSRTRTDLVIYVIA